MNPVPDRGKASGAGPARIWLVDDDEMSRYLHGLIVKRTLPGSEQRQFPSAEDAFNALQDPGSPRPDLIIIDINMPSWDVWDFLAAVGRENLDLSGIRLCILTSELKPDDHEEIARYGLLDSVFLKPLREDMLLQMA